MKKLALLTAATIGFTLPATFASAADMVDTAASAGSFETLVAAVQAAGIVDTLKGEGPFHRVRSN